MKSQWVRRLVIAAGLLVAVLMAVAGLLVLTFDPGRVTATAIEWMLTKHQRTLAIEGPVALSIFPRLTVKATRVRLSERGQPVTFASADEVALALQWLPLLRKAVVVDRLSARGVDATYRRDAQGAANIDDLLDGGEAGAPSTGSERHLGIGAVQLDDLRLNVHDEVAGVEGELLVQSLTTGRLAQQAALPLTLRARVRLTRPRPVDLAIDGALKMAIDSERATASVSELKIEASGEAAGATGLSVLLEGAMDWDGSVLRAQPLRAALKSATLGPLTLAPSTLVVEQLRASPGLRRLDMQGLQMAIAGRSGTSPFEGSLTWPRLAAGAAAIEGSGLSGQLRLSGATALSARFRSAEPGGSIDGLRLPALEVTVESSAGEHRLDAHLRADLLLEAHRRAATLDPLDLRAGIVTTGPQPLQLKLHGRAGVAASDLFWALDGALDNGRVASTGRASFATAVPMVRAAARFDRLDLNRWLPSQPASPASAAAIDTPLPLDMLNAVDGRFEIDAGALAFRQFRLSDLKLDATIHGGTLQVARLAAGAWGGQADASGTIEGRSRRMSLKLAAQGIDVDALLRDVAGSPLLEGKARIAVDLRSGGANLGALRSALAGTVALQVRDGAIRGLDLVQVLRQVAATSLPRQDAARLANALEKTEFHELTASARIEGGIARSDDLDLKSQVLHIGGTGRYDLGRGLVDYTARAEVLDAAAGAGDARWLTSLRGVTVPVTLRGPFDHLEWTIQWSDAAASALEGRVREAIARKLDSPRPAAPAASSARPTPADKLLEQLGRFLK